MTWKGFWKDNAFDIKYEAEDYIDTIKKTYWITEEGKPFFSYIIKLKEHKEKNVRISPKYFKDKEKWDKFIKDDGKDLIGKKCKFLLIKTWHIYQVIDFITPLPEDPYLL